MTIVAAHESPSRDDARDARDENDAKMNDARVAGENDSSAATREAARANEGAIAATARARRAPEPRATTKRRRRGRPPKAKAVEDAGSLFWLVEVRGIERGDARNGRGGRVGIEARRAGARDD